MYTRKTFFIFCVLTNIATLCSAQRDLAYLADLQNTRLVRKSNVLELRERQLNASRKLLDVDIQKTQLTFSRDVDKASETKKLNSKRNRLYWKKCIISLQQFAGYVDLAIAKTKIYWHLARNPKFEGYLRNSQ